MDFSFSKYDIIYINFPIDPTISLNKNGGTFLSEGLGDGGREKLI